jgi:DNA-binding NarL/FixJ family response regulator
MIVPVILADPHPVARAALTALLLQDGGLEVIAAADLAEALRAVARRGAPILIVSRRLLDLGADGMRLPGPLPLHTQTIVVGLEDDPAFAVDARRAGAAAYVLKDRADRDLRPAIDALLDEHRVMTTWQLSA